VSGPAVFYFGNLGSHPGHYLIDGTFHTVWGRLPCGLGAAELDGTFCGDPGLEDPRHRGHWPTDAQPQGLARMHHVRGWTVLAFWDRSGDARSGSNSAIVAEGEHDFETMLALARARFAPMMARIEKSFRIEERAS
jgi:hypothetical protein